VYIKKIIIRLIISRHIISYVDETDSSVLDDLQPLKQLTTDACQHTAAAVGLCNTVRPAAVCNIIQIRV